MTGEWCLDDGDVTCSVFPDGASSWHCVVEWRETGVVVTRDLVFHAAGLPDVVVLSEALALECLAESVRKNPRAWGAP